MAECPTCSQHFSEGVECCPHDGAMLVGPDPLVGRTIEGKYRLDARLASGGMGAVYRATQIALQRTVAVKVILSASAGIPIAVKRFQREALAVAQLKHPHIVAVHDYGVTAGIGAYLVMEFIDGVSLREELNAPGGITLSAALEYTSQICAAVHAAHAAGLVHRDLKPENVILETIGGERIAKVVDFGIARFLDDGAGAATPLTGAFGLLGTPHYMSPEQAKGETAGPESDVYAIGCMLFEMVTGRTPFHGDSTHALLYQHVTARPPAPSSLARDIPPAIEAAILRALEKNPEDRFASAYELRHAIAGVTGEASLTMPLRPSQAETAPRRAAGVAPNNLPGEVTLFVGRERELAGLVDDLGSTRMLTISGPGGVGKTRCAMRLADRVRDGYPDGAWLVELAAINDPAVVADTVADVLGLRDDPGRTLSDVLGRTLKDRRTLLVLDNCEHVITACARLAETLLSACPNLTIVATSREPLGVSGETVWHLDPLPVPGSTAVRSLASALECESVALFVDRARKSRPSFKLTDADVAAVVELCRRLDGVPLALELAAARVKVLSVQQIVERLAGYRILSGGDRAGLPRQQTMQATMDWSYDLLTADEQRLLQRISVFAGNFTLDAAERVAAGETMRTDDVLDLLSSLVDKSLVMADERDDGIAYRMLGMIREYSRARLEVSGDAPAIVERLVEWAIEYVERAFANFGGAGQDVWRSELAREHDNLLAALELAHAAFPESDRPLALAVGLGAYWETYGYWRIAVQWYERLLGALPDCDGILRARALFRMGSLAHRRAELARSRELFEMCLEHIRSTDRTQMIAETLSQLGLIASKTGDCERAIPLLTEALELHRTGGRAITIASALQSLGTATRTAGDNRAAEAWLEQSLDEFRRAKFSQGLAVVLMELASVRMVAGDLERARANAEESLAIAERDDYQAVYLAGCVVAGEILVRQRDSVGARARFGEALKGALELDAFEELAAALEGIAVVDAAEGRSDRALWLAGAAAAMRSVHDNPRSADPERVLETAIERAREAVGRAEADRLETDGAAASVDEVVARASEPGLAEGEAPTIALPE